MTTLNYLELVTDALRTIRQDNLMALAKHPLAAEALAISPFWQATDSHPLRPETPGQALQSLLRWAVDCLKPSGTPNLKAIPWRNYHILHYFYWNHWRWAQLGESLVLSEPRLYECRDQALQQITDIIIAELQQPRYVEHRRNAVFNARYQTLAPEQQTILRAIAVFGRGIQFAQLRSLISTSQIESFAPRLQMLEQQGFIIVDKTTVFCKNDAWYDYLRALLRTPERAAWFLVAAQTYAEQADYLASVQHYRLSGQSQQLQQMITMLWLSQNKLLESGQAAELLAELQLFQPKEFNSITEAQRQLIIGFLANHLGDLKLALDAYRQALGAPLPGLRARAYYQRGRLLRQVQLDEALMHFERAIQLLSHQEALSPDDRLLLGQLYIDCAWIYLQERPDLALAQQALQDANALYQEIAITSKDESRHAADIANALGELYFRQGQVRLAKEQHFRAWLLANEVQETTYILKTCFNLARDYTLLQQYSQALQCLSECQALAVLTQNTEMIGLCAKAVGNCYFMQGDYEQAVQYGLQAWTQLQQADRKNWLAHVSYDLAEAFVHLKDWDNATYYWQQGMIFAEETGDQQMTTELNILQKNHPQLGQPMPKRYQQLLAFIRTHGRVSNREYRELTGISQKQAVRDFNELVASGTLRLVGQGRNTEYALVNVLPDFTTQPSAVAAATTGNPKAVATGEQVNSP